LESARQVERMRELGCELGQGYYFSQPMDAKGAQVYLREQVWNKASGAGAS
jgi:EAL domain-containing protein (putative c-di-GMP-specific phosphodiesterase class I)